MSFFVKMNEEYLNSPLVLYMRRTGAYGRENYELMNSFKEWIKSRELFSDDTVILAVPLDNPNVTNPKECRYDVCMIVSDDLKVCYDDVKSRQLEGGKYVIFLIEHTPDAVQRAWSECFIELEKHGYLFDYKRPVMERYAKRQLDNNYCELCVPVL